MERNEKSGFDNAAMTTYPPESNPNQGYPPSYNETAPGKNLGPGQQLSGNYTHPTQYGYGNQYPQGPYVAQPQPTGYATSNNVIVTTGYPTVVTPGVIREEGIPPDTGCSLCLAIASIFFCLAGWPFAVAAIIYNRKANTQGQVGQLTAAKGSLKTSYILLAVAVVVGIIGWVIFGIRLKYALDTINSIEDELTITIKDLDIWIGYTKITSTTPHRKMTSSILRK